MEPITAVAIIAAISAGITGGTTDLVKQTVIDGYDALKALLKKKFGEQSKVTKAVEMLELMPDSDASKTLVKETIIEAKADQDQEIHQAAQILFDQMKAIPGGEQHIQQAIGSYIAQADRGSTASVTIHDVRDKSTNV